VVQGQAAGQLHEVTIDFKMAYNMNEMTASQEEAKNSVLHFGLTVVK
jgi:hypothetical protein